MNSFTTPPNTEPGDKDLAAQARPGHGVPSQDPDPAAQVALDPEEAKREAKSVMTGGGVVGGAAIGATLGVVVAGPVGVVVGGTLGAVAGALGAAAVGGIASSGSASSDGSGASDSVPARGGHRAGHRALASEEKP